MSRIKAFFLGEIEKGKTMNGRQKVRYIWDYYKLWIIGIVSAIAVFSYVGYRVRHTLADYWFYITFVGTRQDLGTNSDLYNGYVEYTGYDLTEKMIGFNDSSYFDYLNNHAQGNEYYEVCIAYLDAGVLDALTMTPDALVSFGEAGRLLDLESEACASIREKYGDRFLYCEPYDKEYGKDLVPVGIDISDSRLMTEYEIYTDACAIGIGAYTQNLDAVEQFLDYIYEEE